MFVWFVRIKEFLDKYLLVDLLVWILAIFIYIDFECVNLCIIMTVKKILGFLVLSYLMAKFWKIATNKIKTPEEKKKKINSLEQFWFIFCLFALSLFALFLLNLSKSPSNKKNYFRFWFILINVLSIALLYFCFSDHEVINWIFYPIRKKSKYYWNAVFICVSLNLFISLFLSYCNTSSATYSDENKFIWLKFFLVSLTNSLCSILGPSNFASMLIISIMTIINSSLFFILTFFYVYSVKTTFKQKEIIFIPTIKLKKYQNIRLDESLLNYSSTLKIHQFKKEFWDKFSNYKDQIKEELVKGQYIFVCPNENIKIDNVLQKIEDKLGKKLYKKHVKKIDKNTIEFKKFESFKKEIKLMNFSDCFKPLYKIKIPNDENVSQYINEFANKTKLINFQLLNFKKSSGNKKIINFFSLNKENKISLLEDLDNTRLKRVYYVRFKKNDSDTVEINNVFFEKLKLTSLKYSYYYNESKKTLTLKLYIDYNKKLLENDIKNLFGQGNDEIKKCETFLEYKTKSEEEREQILIKSIESNYLVTHNLRWINKFDKNKYKKGNKENQETTKKVYYYVRFKINYYKKLDINTIINKINNVFFEKLKLTRLNDDYNYNESEETLTLKFYGESYVDDDKTAKILNLRFEDDESKGLFDTIDEIKCKTSLEELKEGENEIDKTLYKVIIVTNKSSKLDWYFKEKILTFTMDFENILSFNERIYLSKSSFSTHLKEKHSLQFIVGNNFLGVDNNLKRFKDFISKHQYSYDKYGFNGKENNKLNYQIIPITPLDDWDNPNKPNNPIIKKNSRKLNQIKKIINSLSKN